MLLVERQALTPALLADLLSLRVLYGWSEFLASFFTLYLVIALARPLLLRLAASPWLLAATIALCLGSTLLVTSVDLPLLATLIGTTNYASFPLLPYLPWFLTGIHLGQRGRGPTLLEWALAAAATAGFGWYLLAAGELPQRFPPGALWIIGAALPLALYLALSRFAAARLPLPPLLLAPGRHVLAALLVSNLAIFAIRHLYGRPLRAWWWMLAAGAALLVLVTLWGWTLERWRQRSSSS